MRTEHTLWRVSNGWLLVPEGCGKTLTTDEAPKCSIFKSLKEFADYKPKRERTRRKRTNAELPSPREMKGILADSKPQHKKD